MNTIDVYINKQTDGIAFSLSPRTRKQIIHDFPNAFPTGSIFVNYDTKYDFDTYNGKIEKHIVPILLGIEEAELEKLGEVHFLDPVTNKILYSYPK